VTPIPCIIVIDDKLHLLREYETRTCARCVAVARSNLIAIERDYTLLEAEMLARVGAATPPDPTGRHGDQEPMLGGDILVMLGPGSAAWHSDPVDVDSVLGVLERWERDWRITFGEPAADKPATINRVALYLLRRLQKAAAEHPAFDEFHQDVRIMKSWLEMALRNGPQRTHVPCIRCGRRALERAMPRPDGREVEWVCSSCHQTYSKAEWYVAVAETREAV
jgi:hypothetical protein